MNRKTTGHIVAQHPPLPAARVARATYLAQAQESLAAHAAGRLIVRALETSAQNSRVPA